MEPVVCKDETRSETQERKKIFFLFAWSKPVFQFFAGFFYPTEYGCSLADYDDILSYVFLPEKTGSY